MLLIDETEDKTVNVEKSKFLQRFNALHDYSDTIKTSVNVYDDEYQLVGIYFPRVTYVKVIDEIEKLRSEIKRLRKERE
ncbi:hypothetical protein HUK49_09230 [Limosilactobacillus sp. c11Ua_112_M]|uniref:hypothetical protein n=1 Tax=Limosilactobacillus TaxID=2742598 RepID=UPI0017846061|nr:MULTISPECIES: hypothetical protein [Limosilactobacillus]MBD8088089.1 hypothetical protein [Limosilactobacillus portuensis]MEC4742627.1 hypothetical protein [Limosilactobacillus sp. c10Ua_36]